MNRILFSIIVTLALEILTPLRTGAQGSTTYLSNIGATTGSINLGPGSSSVVYFYTGDDATSYLLNSIELSMAKAYGNPPAFSVMLYGSANPSSLSGGTFNGTSLGTLNGSASPSTAGIYTYTPNSSIQLSPNSPYFIVLSVALLTTTNLAVYEWNNNFNAPASNGWRSPGGLWFVQGNSVTAFEAASMEYAVTATAVPEPTILSLVLSGAVLFLSRDPQHGLLSIKRVFSA